VNAAEYVNGLAETRAIDELGRCCGSTRWARRLAAARPFASDAELLRLADEVWWSLEPEDWLEAFATHPRIGERDGGDWTASEQAGMDEADAEVHRALVAGNRAYEERFGHVFLICATGLSGEEMLAALHRRLSNEPEAEVRVGAAEQAKITRLRLGKLT
jgi:OHCU decarboxylase